MTRSTLRSFLTGSKFRSIGLGFKVTLPNSNGPQHRRAGASQSFSSVSNFLDSESMV